MTVEEVAPIASAIDRDAVNNGTIAARVANGQTRKKNWFEFDIKKIFILGDVV